MTKPLSGNYSNTVTESLRHSFLRYQAFAGVKSIPYQLPNVDWAGLEARVLAHHDSIQLDPSAVVPSNFASLPEREVEDNDCPEHGSDMFDAFAWTFFRRRSISPRLVANSQRHEWLREYASTQDPRTSEDMARQPSSEHQMPLPLIQANSKFA